MWSATDFGGFQNTTDYGGGYMASAAGSSMAKKPSNQGGNVPCTCAEIMTANQEGDRFVSPIGIEFSQVTVVGVIKSVTESATRVEYEVDDYTGAYLPVKMFVEDQDAPQHNQNRAIRESTYVRVNGHIRNFQGTKQVIAFRILPITDMNEVTTHIMEVIFTRMLHAKAKIDESSGGLGSKSGLLNSSSISNTASNNGLDVMKNQILSIVRTFVGERGIPVSQISEKLRGVPERKIREDLDFLSAEGHVYSTVDDDHFRATES